MLILATSDLFGDKQKYLELVTAVRNIKPTYTVIIGDVLSNEQAGKQQIEFKELEEYFKAITDVCPLLFQFSGNDLATTEEYFNKKIQSDLLINISQNNIICDNGIILCGVNYIPDNPFELKDWCRRDGLETECNYQIKKPLSSTDAGFCEIKDYKKQLKKLPSISDCILKKMKTIEDIRNSIWFCYSPPCGLKIDQLYDGYFSGSYDIRKLVEGEYTNKLQPLSIVSGWCSNSPHIEKFWNQKIGKSTCIQCARYGRGLNYVLISIENQRISETWHSKNLLFRK